MATADEPDDDGETSIATRRRVATRPPRRWRVLLHNDDYTTQEFVVEMLRKHFHKSEAEAVHIMLQVHFKGTGIAGIYPRDQAETKVAEVTADAQTQGMPLLLTLEAE